MATDIANLQGSISVNDNGSTAAVTRFTTEVKKAKTELDKMQQGLRQLSEKSVLLRRIGMDFTLYVSLPIAAAGAAALKTAVEFERLRQGLSLHTKTVQELNAQYRILVDIAKAPGIGLEEALKGAVGLQSAGISFERTTKILKEFSNAVAAAGGTREDLEGVITNVKQMFAEGAISERELRQTARRMPQIREYLKEMFGTDVGEELTKKFPVEVIVDRLLKRMELAPRFIGKTQNAFDNFADSIKKASDSIAKDFLPALTDFLNFISPKIEWLGETFRKLPDNIKGMAAALAGLVVFAGPIAHFVANMMMIRTAYLSYQVGARAPGVKAGLEQERLAQKEVKDRERAEKEKIRLETQRSNQSIALSNAELTLKRANLAVEVKDYQVAQLQKIAAEKEAIAMRAGKGGGVAAVGIQGDIKKLEDERVALNAKSNQMILAQERATAQVMQAEHTAAQRNRIAERLENSKKAKQDTKDAADRLKNIANERLAIAKKNEAERIENLKKHNERLIQIDKEIKLQQKNLNTLIKSGKAGEAELEAARLARSKSDLAATEAKIVAERQAAAVIKVTNVQASLEETQVKQLNNQAALAARTVANNQATTAEVATNIQASQKTALADRMEKAKNLAIEQANRRRASTDEALLNAKYNTYEHGLELERINAVKLTRIKSIEAAYRADLARIEGTAVAEITAARKVGSIWGSLKGNLGGAGALFGLQMLSGMLPQQKGALGGIQSFTNQALMNMMMGSMFGPVGTTVAGAVTISQGAQQLIPKGAMEGQGFGSQMLKGLFKSPLETMAQNVIANLDKYYAANKGGREQPYAKFLEGIVGKFRQKPAGPAAVDPEEKKRQEELERIRKGMAANLADEERARKLEEEAKTRDLQADFRARQAQLETQRISRLAPGAEAQVEFGVKGPVLQAEIARQKQEAERYAKTMKTSTDDAEKYWKARNAGLDAEEEFNKLQKAAEEEKKDNVKKAAEHQRDIKSAQYEIGKTQAETAIAGAKDTEDDNRRFAAMLPVLEKRRMELLKQEQELLPKIKKDQDAEKLYYDIRKERVDIEKEVADLDEKAAAEDEENQKKAAEQRKQDMDSYFDALKKQGEARIAGFKDEDRKQAEVEVMIPILRQEQEAITKRVQSLKTGTEEYNKEALNYYSIEEEIGRMQQEALEARDEKLKKLAEDQKKKSEDAMKLGVQRTKTAEEMIKSDPFMDEAQRRDRLVPILLQRFKELMKKVTGETALEREERMTEAMRTRGEAMEAVTGGKRGWRRTLGGGMLPMFDRAKAGYWSQKFDWEQSHPGMSSPVTEAKDLANQQAAGRPIVFQVVVDPYASRETQWQQWNKMMEQAVGPSTRPYYRR